jgi:hypothetical protein
MVWTPPKTWTPSVLTAGELNTHLRDNLLALRQNTPRKVAEVVVTETDVSSLVIGSIPVEFRHFQLVFVGHVTGEQSRVLQWRANWDATANYQRFRMAAGGDTFAWAGSSDGEITSGALGLLGTRRGTVAATISNAQQKPGNGFTSYLGQSYSSTGATSGAQQLVVSGGRWLSSAHITNIEVFASVPFTPSASLSLYGLP